MPLSHSGAPWQALFFLDDLMVGLRPASFARGLWHGAISLGSDLHNMKKPFVLVEALALAAVIVTMAAVNPQTGQMMLEASRHRPAPERRGEDHCFRPCGWHRGYTNG